MFYYINIFYALQSYLNAKIIEKISKNEMNIVHIYVEFLTSIDH